MQVFFKVLDLQGKILRVQFTILKDNPIFEPFGVREHKDTIKKSYFLKETSIAFYEKFFVQGLRNLSI